MFIYDNEKIKKDIINSVCECVCVFVCDLNKKKINSRDNWNLLSVSTIMQIF